jgi:predicted XRE-type DNA-binding protein
MIDSKELHQTEEFWQTVIKNDLFAVVDNLIEKEHYTIAQLHDLLGCTQQELVDLLRGDFNGSIDTMIRILIRCGKVPDLHIKSFDQYEKDIRD